MTGNDLQAVALWRALGQALQASATPRPGGLDLAGSVPAIYASAPPTRVTLSLAWAGARQLQFELEVQLPGVAGLEVEFAGERRPVGPKQPAAFAGPGHDGGYAAVSGKTLTFSLRHHDRGPAVVRAFTDAPFMAHAHPYGALMKPRRLKFGYDATLGLLTTLAGECTVAAGEWFARLRRLGMRCIDEADEGAEIADVRAFAARDHGRILEAPGMVWREARGVARIHGGNPSPDLEVLWGWPERKLRGVARGG